MILEILNNLFYQEHLNYLNKRVSYTIELQWVIFYFILSPQISYHILQITHRMFFLIIISYENIFALIQNAYSDLILIFNFYLIRTKYPSTTMNQTEIHLWDNLQFCIFQSKVSFNNKASYFYIPKIMEYYLSCHSISVSFIIMTF